jgi:hypothetical protein
MPQLPQLFGSELVSVQEPSQNAGVTPIVQVHALATHAWTPAHAVPHCPQSSELVARSTQAPLQSVSPVAHVSVQDPCEQTWDVAQTMPHPPQSFGSDVMSTH